MAAAAAGLAVGSPLAWLANHHGIDVLLWVLVFSTAVGTDPSALAQAGARWRAILIAVVAGAVLLPGLSWLIARAAPAGDLRNGLLTVGLAPCEIASVATTAMAGAQTAVAMAMLVATTLVTVAGAGALLALEAPGARIHTGHIAVDLGLVVALPLAFGLGLGTRRPPTAATQRVGGQVALASVSGLVALIAAEVHLSASYLPVAAGLLGFLAGSALLGLLLGLRSPRTVGVALLLTTSMRDFAVAAGLAAAAFGASSAAPLGLYGVMVLVWGTALAGWLRRPRPGRGRPIPR